MHTLILKTALLGCAAASIAGPALAETVVIRDFIGRVEIVTGGAQFDVEVIDGAAGETPTVDRRGDTIEVSGEDWDRRDGGWWGWGGGWRGRWDNGLECDRDGEDRFIRLERRGQYYRFSELPLVRVTAPADVEVVIERALVDGHVDQIGSGDIGVFGCASLTVAGVTGDLGANLAGSGTLTIGDIGGRLESNIAGSGELVTGRVGRSLDANIAGSGDLTVGAVDGDANLNIAGSGDMRVASVAGRLEGNIAGSGAMTVEGGRSQRLSLSIMGSGDATYGGTADMAEVNVFGSGNVDIANADDSDVHVAGSGDVRVNGVRVATR